MLCFLPVSHFCRSCRYPSGSSCSFQEEAERQWLSCLDTPSRITHGIPDRKMARRSSHSKQSKCSEENESGAYQTHVGEVSRRITSWTQSVRLLLLQNECVIPRGIVTHACNVLLATLLLVWFFRSHETVGLQLVLPVSFVSRCSIWCIYLSQLGVIYDNGVNAVGRYVGEGRLLRVLNKNRFVFHSVSMPLLAIPVTEIATRQSVCGIATQKWISTLLTMWSVTHLIKWNCFHHSNHLRLVDNRESKVSNGPYLPGTLAYTSGAFWDLVLPPLILVLYEVLVGSAILTKSTHSFDPRDSFWSKSSAFLASLPDDAPSSSPTAPPMSAIYLILSGVLTIFTSGMARDFPEIQMLGENLHSVLLWAAYVAK